MRLIMSAHAPASALSAFRNFSRAGVAKNKSRTSIRVPLAREHGRTSPFAPPLISSSQPFSALSCRVVIFIFATEAIDGSASPRNPRNCTLNKSSDGSLDVACRSTASVRSSASMPLPLSSTAISVLPPALSVTSIRVAPASSAFSTSSLTADAGRSITSPAAIWLTKLDGKTRIDIVRVPFFNNFGSSGRTAPIPGRTQPVPRSYRTRARRFRRLPA